MFCRTLNLWLPARMSTPTWCTGAEASRWESGHPGPHKCLGKGKADAMATLGKGTAFWDQLHTNTLSFTCLRWSAPCPSSGYQAFQGSRNFLVQSPNHPTGCRPNSNQVEKDSHKPLSAGIRLSCGTHTYPSLVLFRIRC